MLTIGPWKTKTGGAAQAAARQKAICVADTVLVELAWTLVRVYRRDRSVVAAALRALATHATVKLESGALILAAVAAFEAGPADFADCLLCVKAQALECDEVATFDRGMKALPRVTLPA